MRRRPHAGFTLVEMLVVVFIVVLVSVVTLPTIVPALTNRQVGEAARILQAALAGARDRAIRFNGPQGIRLIPDNSVPGALTCSRLIALEPAQDVTEGMVTFPNYFNFVNPTALPGNTGQLNATWQDASGAATTPPAFPFPFPGDASYLSASGNTSRGVYPWVPSSPGTSGAGGSPASPPVFRVLLVEQAVFNGNNPAAGPSSPTNWFWNVRIGDRFRFGDSGRYYTIVGPMTIPNPEYFVNDGLPGATTTLVEDYVIPGTPPTRVNPRPEFLFLVNGVDDDSDAYIDNGVNGVNENLNAAGGKPMIDDMVGLSGGPGEWTETEQWLGSQEAQSRNYQAPLGGGVPVLPTMTYTIARRPVPVAGAQEVALPAGAVIDLTTWDSTRERSRLPVDPNTLYVDVMLNQAGQVIPTTTYSNPASASMDQAFYHFWVTNTADVAAPVGSTYPLLPVGLDVVGTAPVGATTVRLTKDRVLVTLFARTGAVVTNSVEKFDYGQAWVPYTDAQLGIREAK